VQLVRSATVVVSHEIPGGARRRLLIDPVLADPGTEAPIAYSNTLNNPRIALPIDKRQLLAGVDAVLITHAHPDHFDQEAERILPRDMLIFCQPYDERGLRDKGFENLRVVTTTVAWDGMTLSRFPASHYPGATGAPPFGVSSSYLLQTPDDAVFVTGDAILDDKLRTSLATARPPLIVANTGACQFSQANPVLAPGVTMTLTAEELKQIATSMPSAKIVAVHMDAINHCPLTKAALRTYVDAERLGDRILVPSEGDVVPRRDAASPR
jgi:L-ascorbate metabolism protein UlaG (beta-lactamase superfamily)